MHSSVSYDSVGSYVRGVIDQVRAVPESFSRSSKVQLPGLDLEVRAFDGELADAVESNLLQRIGASVPSVEKMEVFIAHSGIAGIPEPAIWEREVYAPHRVSEVLAAQGLRGSFYFGPAHWHLYDAEEHIAVQLMCSPDGYPPWEPGAPLRPFLHWHYAQRGMRLAHCGTLGVNGVGVMLAGEGGSGKSGTVIAGLLGGLESVGDDYVLLGFERELVAYPLFSTLKQDAEGFARLGLGRFVPDARPLNWQDKHQFTLEEIRQGPPTSSLKIRALFVPRVSGLMRTEITPLGQREAMLALAMSSISQMPGDRESGFRFFSAVTKQLPCYRLELGREAEENAGSIGRFIEGLPDED